MTDFATQYGQMSREAFDAEMDKKFGVDEPIVAIQETKNVNQTSQESLAAADEVVQANRAETEKSFISDVGSFLKEVPVQLAAGAMDAVNNTVDAARDLGRAAGIPDYVLQITNEAGEFDPMFLSPEETKAGGSLSTGWLPELDKAETAAGGFTRAITAFAIGFVPVSKGLKAAGMTSRALRAYTAGAVADGITSDPHASRLSTLLNEVPVLQDIVPDYMADNNPENENIWEGRMKNAIEGLVIGGAADAIVGGAVKMLKGYKMSKAAKRLADAQPKTVDDMVTEDLAKATSDAKAADDMIADVELDMGAVMLDAGYKFNDYIAVEARYWIGIDADDATFSDWTVHNAVDTDTDAWGVYVKPMYPVTDAFDIYGLLGYGSASLNDSATFDGDVEGISWGVGAAYSFTESFSVFLDYVAFTDDTLTNNSLTHLVGVDATEYDHEFDTINFGLNYQF